MRTPISPEHRCKRCYGQGFQYPSPKYFESIGVPMPPKLAASCARAKERGDSLRRCTRCHGSGMEPELDLVRDSCTRCGQPFENDRFVCVVSFGHLKYKAGIKAAKFLVSDYTWLCDDCEDSVSDSWPWPPGYRCEHPRCTNTFEHTETEEECHGVNGMCEHLHAAHWRPVLVSVRVEDSEQPLFARGGWLCHEHSGETRCTHIMAGTTNEKCWLATGHTGDHERSPIPHQEWGER